MKQMSKKIVKSQKGQAAVEFALVLPMFIILVFSIMEFSRLWETVSVLTSAAREGARAAAVTAPPDVTAATNAAQNILTAGNISNATITLAGPNAANEVIVTVSITYTPLTGNIVPGVGSMTLTRSTTMHWEG
jgi:Flp pilus assembly protein TadG